MSTSTLTKANVMPCVGMSEIAFLEKGEEVKSVVGSCIALSLCHPRTGKGALAHIVLPAANGRNGAPGKFADTAIPHMLKSLQIDGCNQSGLVAKICGGANMFGGKGPIQVGVENTKAVTEALQGLGIPIQGESVGGKKGRRITFNSETGNMMVEIAGEEPIIL